MDEDLKLADEDTVQSVLSAAFGEPVHISAEDYLGKVIAGCFSRQPHMSGDQRNRLDPRQRRIVDDTARILAATITRLHASRTAYQDTIEGLVKERDAAIRKMTAYAREAGLAKGVLEASEMAGVVDGWKTRAETAEAQRDAALEALRPFAELARAVVDEGSPDYREWVGESKDWMVIFSFAGQSVRLGDLRALHAASRTLDGVGG